MPNRTHLVSIKAKKRARKLYDNFLRENPCVIMDDETYCKADFQQLNGRQLYVQKLGKSINMKFKIIRLDKFSKKYMVWQATCSCGLQSASFMINKTMNQDVYIKECLQKRLLPLIRKHNIPTLFWPDLASYHYAKRILSWYDDNNVHFVPKIANPPNCPELRPIEVYWALVKRTLKKIKNPARDIISFKNKWKNASLKVTVGNSCTNDDEQSHGESPSVCRHSNILTFFLNQYVCNITILIIKKNQSKIYFSVM